MLGRITQAAAKDKEAVLLFSGGYTRADAGQLSEAGSYWQVADALDWFGYDDVKLKTVLEVCVVPGPPHGAAVTDCCGSQCCAPVRNS